MSERAIDFSMPPGEPALVPPDSLSWQIFKNPVVLFAGGVSAVLLELAEPRVRSGIWDHTTFRDDPLARMERTGLAAMVTVYGARSVAEKMIAGVCAMHARIRGTTPRGEPYRADDPELLDWVQATASFGFLEAYAVYVRPVSDAERDRFYAEGVEAGRLYGAVGAPASLTALRAQFDRMRPKLERSAIVFEFLDVLHRARILPWPLGRLQSTFIRSGVEITPVWARDILGLGGRYGLSGWERSLVGALGALADRVPVPSSPPVQACKRLGLPWTYLYQRNVPRRLGPSTRVTIRPARE
jgi:uncharacterized protein (DUF2236 family)